MAARLAEPRSSALREVCRFSPIQPVVLELDAYGIAADAGGFVREWRRPDERRFVNVGYALQWWAFAATTFALWLVLSFPPQRS